MRLTNKRIKINFDDRAQKNELTVRNFTASVIFISDTVSHLIVYTLLSYYYLTTITMYFTILYSPPHGSFKFPLNI